MQVFVVVAIVLCAGALAACGDEPVEKVSEGVACGSDANCFDGHVCVAASAAKGKVCTRTCVDTQSAPEGFYCGDGERPIGCEGADESECASCGCADDAELCEPGVGCHPRAAVGEACDDDNDCASSNCSTFAGVCRVAVGSACTADNCDICWTLPDWSWCSRECTSYQCGTSGTCLGNSIDPYTCRPICAGSVDSSCPGSCSALVDDPSQHYCECPDCDIKEPPHQLGELCREDSQCTTQNCMLVLEDCERSFSGCRYLGVCSKACTTSADCEAGSRCGEGHCLMPCDPMTYEDCPTGTSCALTTVVEGVTGMPLCDPRHVNGTPCHGDTDCQSGVCTAGLCRGKVSLGYACVTETDCIEGHCCGGKCASACQN
ncbi:MAG: hypothetical protein QM778_33365 [Myxococcales bacterium]